MRNLYTYVCTCGTALSTIDGTKVANIFIKLISNKNSLELLAIYCRTPSIVGHPNLETTGGNLLIIGSNLLEVKCIKML